MNKIDKNLNLATFFSLYIAQSIPMSFFSTVIPVMMRQESFSLSTIGMLQLIKLPWILKFIWAPFVDRNTTTLDSFKRCIFTSELIYAVLIFAISFLDFKADFNIIMPLIVAAFIASGTQDIATDALAVLSFNKHDKSMVNSMQSMGSFGGSIVGGGLMLFLFHQFGWGELLPFLSIFVIIAVLPLFFNKTIELQPNAEHKTRAKKADFVYFFHQKSIWKQVLFLLLCYSGLIGILTMSKPYFVDLGYDMKEIGFISGVVGTGTGFIAAWIGGRAVRKIGIFKCRIFFAVLSLLASSWFAVMSLTTPSTLFLYIGIMLVWACYGMTSIIVYTTAMECVREGREGTDFTIQTVITHLSGMIMAVLSGKIADLCGYSGIFTIEVLLTLVYLCYVLVIFKPKSVNN